MYHMFVISSMAWCKRDVTPVLMHWSYVYFASSIEFILAGGHTPSLDEIWTVLVQIMAFCWKGDKTLSVPMMSLFIIEAFMSYWALMTLYFFGLYQRNKIPEIFVLIIRPLFSMLSICVMCIMILTLFPCQTTPIEWHYTYHHHRYIRFATIFHSRQRCVIQT